MIFKIEGSLEEAIDDFIVIKTGGLGYQVFVPITVLNTLPEKSEPVSLYTYHHIREDSQKLFGFPSLDERSFFLSLISVSGVGPKVGMKVLSHLDIASLVTAIQTGDSHTLVSVPGVGKKVAEKIIIELNDKLPSTLSVHVSSKRSFQHNLDDDLFLALKTLGYKRDEINKCLSKAGPKVTPEKSLEENLKVLLKHL
ncbi:Holliday junction branch migration protein RuvA [Candidatus Marinamargulisbacteria bacterium SCGC AAA071-K20]|nr:Holliday junction branch migration protein RuvA [Candidatus Marinamargulisbacteria bacterium SCGC AAA071-K20]